MRTGIIVVLAAVLAAGCSSVGKVSSRLTDLYDMADPAGTIELELSRNGTVLEMEADVPIEALPENIVAAAKNDMPGAKITGAEREFQAGGGVWEVKLTRDGRAYELLIDERGVIREREKEITEAECPDVVLDTARKTVTGGRLRSTEIIEKGKAVEYHVKFDREGASWKVVLSPAGKVLRFVREHRAEIEIPVRTGR